MSFISGFRILQGARPGFDLTHAQASVWASLLSDIHDEALVHGAMKLGQDSEYPYTVAAWRKCALAFVDRDDPLGHDAAWDEMRRNRAIEMSLVYEQRADVIAHRRAKITWSSEASRRAADYVGWTDPNWNADDLNTLRAQHRGAYQSVVERQTRIDGANDVRAIERTVRDALEGKQHLLGGGP